MKNLVYLFCLTFLISCGNQPSKEEVVEPSTPKVKEVEPESNTGDTTPEPKPEVTVISKEQMIGNFVGGFIAKEYDADKKPSWTNRINIKIEKVEDGKVEGKSIVAGNFRPFKGKINGPEKDGNYTVVAEEPGDDKYDGTFFFKLSLNTDGKPKMKGEWLANDKNLAVTVREYNLEQMEFKYDVNNPNLGQFDYASMYGTYNEATGEEEFLTDGAYQFNASKQLLTKKDVENLHKGDLEVIRNAIYARHGYSFKNRKMRYLFDAYATWYVPYSVDIREDLTELEKKNIDLLKRYEQHAERYYDSFGR